MAKPPATVAGPITGRELEWVVVRWNTNFGFHYVGPFRNAAAAADWADPSLDPNWQVGHLDPAVSLVVRDPGPMPPLQPDPEPDPDLGEWLRKVLDYDALPTWLGDPADYSPHDHWTERQSARGNFYLLMIDNEPLHLVGPFADHRHAYSWAVDYQARTEDEGWQVIWLDDAGRAPVLRRPDLDPDD
jgi:hypothetical protein